MPCSQCKHENAPGAKFCLECGEPLPPGAKFCLECGASSTAAVTRMRPHEMRRYETRTRVRLATAGMSAVAAIRRDLDDALALCERNSTPALEPLIREQMARLHALRGEADRAAQVRRTGLELYTTLGAVGHCPRLRRKLASLGSRQPA